MEKGGSFDPPTPPCYRPVQYTHAYMHILQKMLIKYLYIPEHALSRLKWSYPLLHKEDQYLNQLAQAVVQLRLGEPAEAEACLMSIPSEGMIQACLRYHNILHVDLTSLSHVAQLSRQSTPKMFIDILVALHDEGVFTMDVAVKLLQGELSTTDLWTNTHIRDYLEMLLSNPSRQFIFKEGSILLAQIYLDRLRHWRPVQTRTLPTPGHSHIPKGRGHFGKRQAWLDEMTPFKGTQSIFHQPCTKLQLSAAQSKLRHRIASDPVQINRSRQAADLVTPEMKQRSSENLDVHTVVREKAGNVEGECSCCCCNEDLLKLQVSLSIESF
ncbi:uncharacterized protein LOC106151090 [Lingula anatina]|uniref:Uncharacterized protein LOC106151090 n=1 Tax=Lingula anatina TaxID=7574 RepID=A0A1S3H0V3_LINAN|nr:uncharacterized protein LOC106151090 [Lingula anatina]|eukprot:XP_013379633.1 uncharacterized protein LOC106151090 [Lingula anatina]